MFRPEGWRSETDGMAKYLPSREVAFEAGADAMLEGLKKEAIHIRTMRGWESLKECYEDWLHGGKVGYLVFIPEDKE